MLQMYFHKQYKTGKSFLIAKKICILQNRNYGSLWNFSQWLHQCLELLDSSYLWLIKVRQQISLDYWLEVI